MKKSMYEYLETLSDNGCTNCPFTSQCKDEAGYTQMDEYGSCPVNNIETQEDFDHAKFSEDLD